MMFIYYFCIYIFFFNSIYFSKPKNNFKQGSFWKISTKYIRKFLSSIIIYLGKKIIHIIIFIIQKFYSIIKFLIKFIIYLLIDSILYN